MTDKFISAKGSVLLFSEEAVYGTIIAPSRPVGIIQSWSVDEKRAVQQVYGQGSSTMLALTEGEYDITGSLSVSLQRADILEYLIGAPTDAPALPTTGPYTHTFDKISEGVKSITIGLGLYDVNSTTMLVRNQIKGVNVKKCEIVCSENKEVMLNIDWEGIANDHDTTSIVAVNMSETVFGPKKWKFNIGAAGGTASHRATVTNCTITMTRDMAKAWGNGDNKPLRKDVDKFVVKITGGEFFTDKSIYEDFQGSSTVVGAEQTSKKISVVIDNGLSTTYTRKLELTFDNCKLSGGFKLSQPSSTSFVKSNFSYDGFLSSIVATDNTANWNA